MHSASSKTIALVLDKAPSTANGETTRKWR